MSDSGYGAQGTTLFTSTAADGTGSATRAIAEVLSLSGPGLELNLEDATDLTETWDSHIATILRGGEITMELNFRPDENSHRATGSFGLVRDLKQRTKRNFALTFSDTGDTSWTFSAYVIRFEPSASAVGKLMANATLRLTGTPVLS